MYSAQLPAALLRNSSAHLVLDCPVRSVERVDDTWRVMLDNGTSVDYDVVALAAPFVTSSIALGGPDVTVPDRRPYQQVYTTFVEGRFVPGKDLFV